jgi:O-antigen/teichoic acid export membrane protein
MQVFRNFTINIILFICNIIIGIWMTPFLIHKLGVSSYSFIPLTTSIVTFLGLATISTNSSIARFLTLDIQKNNFEAATKTFSTAVSGNMLIIAGLFPVAILFVFICRATLTIPDSVLDDATFLFGFTALSFLISTCGSMFLTVPYAYNRLDLRSGNDFIRYLTRIILIIGLFYFFKSSLVNYGIAALLSEIAALITSIFIWKKIAPSLHYRINKFDKKILKEMLTMSSWVLLNQTGSLLFLNTELIIVNKICGPANAGEYGSILQWSYLLRSMAGVMAAVATPIALQLYSNGEIKNLERFIVRSVKFLGLFLAIPIGLLCGIAKPLLNLWLGHQFAYLAPLMILLILHLCINLSVLPLFSLQICFNKVKTPGFVTLITGVLNVAGAVALSLTNLSFYGIAIAGMISLSLKNVFFTTWYGAKLLSTRICVFLIPIMQIAVATISVFLISSGFTYFIGIKTWLHFIGISIVITIVYVPVAYFVFLSSEDKLFLNKNIKNLRLKYSTL